MPPSQEVITANTMERIGALGRERAQLVSVLSGLSAAQWHAPSMAEGWLVRDVVAHLGATSRLLLGPRVRQVLTSRNAEAFNDLLVERRRGWEVTQILAEFERCTARLMVTLPLLARPPLGVLRVPIAELGNYPLRLTPSLLLFDWHVHLRHDIAPALGLSRAATDADRMNGVLEWMMAGMEQMNRTTMGFLDRPLSLRLSGIGGDTWLIRPLNSGRLQVTRGRIDDAAAEISATAVEFPAWATRRSPWRSADISIEGDTAYAIRFLETLNIV